MSWNMESKKRGYTTILDDKWSLQIWVKGDTKSWASFNNKSYANLRLFRLIIKYAPPEAIITAKKPRTNAYIRTLSTTSVGSVGAAKVIASVRKKGEDQASDLLWSFEQGCTCNDQ